MNNSTESLLHFLIAHFKGSDNYDLEDFLHAFGKMSDALLYTILFSPEFIEIEGSIFLKNRVDNFDEVKKILTNTPKLSEEIERNINFAEVGYLFDSSGRDVSDEYEFLLAKRIKKVWTALLHYKYPTRYFSIEILSPEETGSCFGIQFYEKRKV